MKANVDLEIGRKTFASGLLPQLISGLRLCRPGDLVAVVGDEQSIGPELETWCRFTGNPLLEATVDHGRARWVFRCGTVAAPAGRRAESLRVLPRNRIVLQISLDSATPELHDLHRGPGTWARTREGIQRVRAHGFRVRLAATVSTDAEAEAFREFLDEEKIAAEDRVIRRIALRGAASEGVAVTRADLVPEVTITVEGVYWHPVGAEDSDLLITRDIFPLAESFAAVRRAFDREGEHANKLARIFNCA